METTLSRKNIENYVIGAFGAVVAAFGAAITWSVLMEVWRYRYAFSFQSVLMVLILSLPLSFGLALVALSAGLKKPYRIAAMCAMCSIAAFAVHVIGMFIPTLSVF